METLKLYVLPALLAGTWAVVAAGTMVTLTKLPMPDEVPQKAPIEAPIEEPAQEPEPAPYVARGDRVS